MSRYRKKPARLMTTPDRAAGEETELQAVLALRDKYRHSWQDRDDGYWLQRLMQEVGELASSLAGDHDDPPEHELRQIASIALNWLDQRAEAAR